MVQNGLLCLDTCFRSATPLWGFASTRGPGLWLVRSSVGEGVPRWVGERLTHTAQHHQELLLWQPEGVLGVLEHTQQAPTGAVFHHQHLLPAGPLRVGQREAWGGGCVSSPSHEEVARPKAKSPLWVLASDLAITPWPHTDLMHLRPRSPFPGSPLRLGPTSHFYSPTLAKVLAFFIL